MVAPRRFLPSISMLVAFEAVARHESVTTAASELSLTQGAVSRQIQGLEEQLGVSLFEREKKRLRLNLAGSSYAYEIRGALKRIADASLHLRANPDGGTLNLAILPTFGTRWLAPRLADFLAQHTGITVNLSTRLTQFDFGVDGQDAAIQFGEPTWLGAECMALMDELVMPVCAPSLLGAKGIKTAADLLELPLLHLGSRPNAWEQWMRSNEVDFPILRGMLFDQFATMSKAAVYGTGVALLPMFLIERELKEGLLVSAFGEPVASPGCYYLAWPKHKSDYKPLIRFRQWLGSELNNK